MERIPVPTAPSERTKWQNPQPKRIGWLLLTLLLSLVTGFSGALLAKTYQLDLLTPTTPEIIVVPENTASGSSSIVHQLQQTQSEAVVLVKQADAVLGMGVVLSSDGWIVALAQPLVDQTEVMIETETGRSYPSDAMVFDAVTGLVYIHINQTGLRVAQFRNVPAVLGENMVAYTRTLKGDQAAFTAIGLAGAEEIALDRILPAEYLGAPLYDLDYSIIGFATDTTAVIPISAVNDIAYGLFTTGQIVRDLPLSE